jgi:fructose-1,6-bisphosphatase/inositol monophosphatase family enzyme
MGKPCPDAGPSSGGAGSSSGVDASKALLEWLLSIVKSADEVRRRSLKPVETPEGGENEPLALVAKAERAVHSFLWKAVADRFPYDSLLSTTGDHEKVSSERIWVINPISKRDDLGQIRWWISVCLVQQRPRIFAIFVPEGSSGFIYSGGPGLSTTMSMPGVLSGMRFKKRGPDTMRSDAFGVVAPPEISDEDPQLEKFRNCICAKQGVTFRPRNSFELELWAIVMNQCDGLIGLDVLPYHQAAMLLLLQEALNVVNSIEDWLCLDPTRKVTMWVGMRWQAETTFEEVFTD